MPNFDSTWARQETQSVTGKLRDAVKPQGALKPRIQTAVNKLQVQISKMDSMLGKLQRKRCATLSTSRDCKCNNMILAQVEFCLTN